MLISQAMDAEPMDSVVVFFHSEAPDFQTVEKSESLGIKGVVDILLQDRLPVIEWQRFIKGRMVHVMYDGEEGMKRMLEAREGIFSGLPLIVVFAAHGDTKAERYIRNYGGAVYERR